MSQNMWKGEAESVWYDIPGAETWKCLKKIDRGWSSDTKYLLIDEKNQKRLLRISDGSEYVNKQKEYDVICKYNQLDFVMSRAIGFGMCDGGKHTYMLLSWVEGEDLETALPGLPEKVQYELGVKAGKILKQIHSVEVDVKDLPQETKIPKKLMQLETYEHSSLRVEGDERVLQYVKEHIHDIWSIPPVYQHGDFHPGNLILMGDNEIGVIDFNRWEIGDPYEEFYKLECFGTEASIPYCRGEIDGYFGDRIPDDFFQILAVYVAHTTLYSMKWAEKFGQDEMDGMVRRYHQAVEHYNNFEDVIPNWYRQE